MSRFVEARYWYKKLGINKNANLFGELDRNWRRECLEMTRMSRQFLSTHGFGWCISCCRKKRLLACIECSIIHVCSDCLTTASCFLSFTLSQETCRTVKCMKGTRPTKVQLERYVKFMDDSFPVNADVVNRIIKYVSQRKCRTELSETFYSMLVLPITLRALVLSHGDYDYYIFGEYENSAFTDRNYPFYFIDLKEELGWLDQFNIERASALPSPLRDVYAKSYLMVTRTAVIKNTCTRLLSYNHYVPSYKSCASSEVKYTQEWSFDMASVEWARHGLNKYDFYVNTNRTQKSRLNAMIRQKRSFIISFADYDLDTILKEWNNMLKRSTPYLNKVLCIHSHENWDMSECPWYEPGEGPFRWQYQILTEMIEVLGILHHDYLNTDPISIWIRASARHAQFDKKLRSAFVNCFRYESFVKLDYLSLVQNLNRFFTARYVTGKGMLEIDNFISKWFDDDQMMAISAFTKFKAHHSNPSVMDVFELDALFFRTFILLVKQCIIRLFELDKRNIISRRLKNESTPNLAQTIIEERDWNPEWEYYLKCINDV